MGNQLGQPVNSFAYPCTFPEADRAFFGRLRETLIPCGYRSFVTTIASCVTQGDDLYTLRRLPMNGADDPALLMAKLEGAYDWMEPAQQIFKRVKRVVSGAYTHDQGATLGWQPMTYEPYSEARSSRGHGAPVFVWPDLHMLAAAY